MIIKMEICPKINEYKNYHFSMNYYYTVCEINNKKILKWTYDLYYNIYKSEKCET